MDEQRAAITALPIDDRPEVHEAGAGSGRSAPVPLEQEKSIREGRLPEDRFDDDRMKDLSNQDGSIERERTERGNRGPDEEPGFGQGA
jgi:hypothetical protein